MLFSPRSSFRRAVRCVAVDAVTAARRDPTGTGAIRRRAAQQLDARWRTVIGLLRDAVLERDMLGTAGPLTAAAGASSVQLAFQRWFDHVLAQAILEHDGAWFRPVLARAHAAALSRAQRMAANGATRDLSALVGQGQVDAMATLAVVELQGVMEAVSQRVVREASLALVERRRASPTFRAMAEAVRKVGMVRGRAVIDYMTVKMHAASTLDAFAAAQVQRVGLIPERKPVPTLRRRAGDARRRAAGPGSRISREETPSRRTVERIRRAQEELEAQIGEEVFVETAGDEFVCEECEDIEAGGPYTIDEARSLIPAHVRCRCAFVPTPEEERR